MTSSLRAAHDAHRSARWCHSMSPPSSRFRVSRWEGGRSSLEPRRTVREQPDTGSYFLPSPSSAEAQVFVISSATPVALVPSITRHLVGRTWRDTDVDRLPAPEAPLSVRFAVATLRWYRHVRPPSIGNRCVWDPSCSRYAELVIRQRGVLRGLLATIHRLAKCRPARGGIDLPNEGELR
jgi:putative component of membrane protein insertase Oxa1/YidC/SpoIIIJ protein YidD